MSAKKRKVGDAVLASLDTARAELEEYVHLTEHRALAWSVECGWGVARVGYDCVYENSPALTRPAGRSSAVIIIQRTELP